LQSNPQKFAGQPNALDRRISLRGSVVMR
jgi:hypothetical protein